MTTVPAPHVLAERIDVVEAEQAVIDRAVILAAQMRTHDWQKRLTPAARLLVEAVDQLRAATADRGVPA